MKKLIRNLREKMPSRAQVAGAIQGVIGDKLPQRLQTSMHFIGGDKPLKGHVVLFVHGSADTEAGWQAKKGELNFGDQLLLDFGVASVYVRYNSGLAVSENGEKLATLINEFTEKHRAVRKLTLIGHSMGGLVIHSALYHAQAQKLRWIKKVEQVFLIGTPHAGAPLAKIAEKGEQILQFIPNPITLIAASVVGLRSRGLKDLSRGEGGLPAGGNVLLPRVRYVFIAGGVQKKRGGVINRLLGDGMVREPSAHRRAAEAEPRLAKLIPYLNSRAKVFVETVPGAGHLALRHSPDVYGVISGYFRA